MKFDQYLQHYFSIILVFVLHTGIAILDSKWSPLSQQLIMIYRFKAMFSYLVTFEEATEPKPMFRI